MQKTEKIPKKCTSLRWAVQHNLMVEMYQQLDTQMYQWVTQIYQWVTQMYQWVTQMYQWVTQMYQRVKSGKLLFSYVGNIGSCP